MTLQCPLCFGKLELFVDEEEKEVRDNVGAIICIRRGQIPALRCIECSAPIHYPKAPVLTEDEQSMNHHYLQSTDGRSTDKAVHFVFNHGAKLMLAPEFLNPCESGLIAVCVIQNESHDAAVVVTSEQVLLALIPTAGDPRQRKWLAIDIHKAAELCETLADAFPDFFKQKPVIE